MAPPTAGEPAPDFELPSTGGRPVRLSDLKGRPVVLFFYPKDMTSGCTAEACAFQASLPDFSQVDAEIFGISRDSLESHAKFREKEGLTFDLLSDGVEGLGYLLKERVTQVDDLVRALHDVARGGSALDPKVVEGLLARKNKESSSALHGLTERELEVLRELATGRSNAATAKALYMSERAVEKHVGSVFQKLGLVSESDTNRRVMAVLAYLDATGGAAAR